MDAKRDHLPVETIHTIHEWGNKTFGPNRTPLRVAIRAHRELSEVFTLFQKPNSGDKILNELADVAIVMCGYLPKLFSEAECIAEWRRLNTSMSNQGLRDPLDAVLEANNHMSFLMGHLYVDERKGAVPSPQVKMLAHKALNAIHMAAVNYLGSHNKFPVAGRSFWSEVDYKMGINRLRTWEVDFDTGDAQHVDPVKWTASNSGPGGGIDNGPDEQDRAGWDRDPDE